MNSNKRRRALRRLKHTVRQCEWQAATFKEGSELITRPANPVDTEHSLGNLLVRAVRSFHNSRGQGTVESPRANNTFPFLTLHTTNIESKKIGMKFNGCFEGRRRRRRNSITKNSPVYCLLIARVWGCLSSSSMIVQKIVANSFFFFLNNFYLYLYTNDRKTMFNYFYNMQLNSE